MKTFKRSTLLLLLSIFPACGQQLVEFPNPDGGKSDTRIGDSTNGDGAIPDVEIPAIVNADGPSTETMGADFASFESGSPDTPNGDGADTDAPGLYGRLSDTGNPDKGGPDTGNPDKGTVDATIGDSRVSDLPVADTRVFDLAITDISIIEAPIFDVSNIDVAIVDTSTNEPGGAEALNDGTQTSACRQAPVFLGAADSFVVLAGSTVTNTGPTSVTGDLGVSPGTAVTGFPPGAIVGTQHAGDPTAAQGVADLTAAYNDAAGRTLCAVTVSGNLGGQTLTPGLYKSTSSLALSSGDLTLDAQGDATAVFVFQMASTLTTTSGRQVILSGGAKSTNVFWQVGTSATLGSTSAFQGTVMADQAITLNTGATLNGRALARIAGVTLDSNTIVKPAP
jgi:hypothetical protein